MNVLHLSSESAWRGGEQQIAYLIEELQKLGVNNTIACHKGAPFEAYCQKQGWHHHSLPFKNSLDVGTALAVKRICAAEGIDIVHMHSSKAHGIAWLAGLLGNKTPLVLSRRVVFPPKTNFLTRKKYNYHRIRRILCVSDAIRKLMLHHIKEGEKCVTVYSGIDLKKFENLAPKGILRSTYAVPEQELLIGNISALSPEKDYITFIDTAALVLKRGVAARFFIIGAGAQEAALKAYVQENELQEKVVFTGFMKNMPEIFPELDIFLMPSAIEGLGTTLLDAFACKVPVVSSRAGGIPEIVIHEQTGLSAPVKDAAGLAENIVRLVQDKALREKLVARAFELVQSFDKTQTAAQTLKEYEYVLQEGK